MDDKILGGNKDFYYLDILGGEDLFYVEYTDESGDIEVTKLSLSLPKLDLTPLLKCKHRHGYVVRRILETLAEDGV